MDGAEKNIQKETPILQEVSGDASTRIIKPSRTLLTWEAPERIFVKRSPEYYRKIAVIIVFLALLLLIIKEFLLIGILAIIFVVVYIFHTIPPGKVRHEITTNGVNYASQHAYKWDELDNFFIEKKAGVNILNINTKRMLPGRIFLLLDMKTTPAEVTRIINEYLSVMDVPEKSVIEQFTANFAKKIKL